MSPTTRLPRDNKSWMPCHLKFPVFNDSLVGNKSSWFNKPLVEVGGGGGNLSGAMWI